MVAHRVLSLIDIPVDRRQRTVITNRTGQNRRHMIFFTVIDDPILNIFLIQKSRNGTARIDPINCIQMIVMAIGDVLPRLDILPESSMEIGAFHIVSRQGIAG